jgi:short-subunit dehydrogenase
MPANKTAVITGASSGIGASYADRLARRGYNLILVARRADRLDALAGALTREHNVQVTTKVADLATADGCRAIETAITTDQTVDVLVNNAGIGQLRPLAETTPADLSSLIDVNVLALARLSLAGLQAFRKRGGGTIINMSSISAFRAVAGGAAYSASKAFVLNFTRSLQLEAAGSDVRFQCVMPGPVKTEFLTAAGVDDSLFPTESFITADELVDAALAGLDFGEDVTIPTLDEPSAYQTAVDAFTELREQAGRKGIIAKRYRR